MKKDVVKMLVVFVVFAGAVFWALNYLFLSGNTAQRSKAAGETIDISYEPAEGKVEAGKDMAVVVRMKPSAQISLRGYTVKFKFDKTILKAKYIDYKIGVPSPDFGDTSSTLASVNETGTINIQGEIQNATGLIMADNSTVDLVRLVFTAMSATGNTIIANNANFYLVGSDGSISASTLTTVPNYKVNGGTTAAVCTNFSDDFSASKLDTAKWEIVNIGGDSQDSISAINSEVNIAVNGIQSQQKTNYLVTKSAFGGDFTAEVLLKSLASAGGASSGANLTFSITPTDTNEANHSINVVRHLGDGTLSATKNSGSGTTQDQATANIGLTANSPVKVKIERKGAKANVFYDINDGQGYKLMKAFNDVSNVPMKLSVSSGSFEPEYPKVTAKADDIKLTCLSTAPAVTPTGSTTVTGNTKLNLKLKFQGIIGKPDDSRNSMNVKFTLSGADLATPLVKSETFSSDANGIWTGKVGFDLTAPAGKKYILYVKGPKHIQKKICDNSPTETASGTYRCSNANITLTTGDNNMDLSKVLLLSGDVYGSNKVQDGIVNSVDISYIKNNLSKSDASVLGICDINLDGKCDTQDYSLIISALSIKSDEL